MSITVVFDPPQRSDPDTFSSKADTLLGTDLPAFVTQANALAEEMNNNLNASALGVTATSSSSVAIGTGAKSFTIETGRGYVVGMTLKAASTADPAGDYMVGTVTAYNGGTGALTLEVERAIGSGTLASWALSVYQYPARLNGGASGTASVVLTNASTPVQRITPATWGHFFELPDATTIDEGGPVFFLENHGDYDVSVRDAGGTVRGFIAPHSSVAVSCLDNASAAGSWMLDGKAEYGVAAGWEATNTFTLAHAVALDADRTLLLGRGASNYSYAIIHDASDNSWGNLTLLRAVAGYPAGVLVGTDSVLVFANESTQVAALVLSISGKTVTPNTAQTAAATVHNAIPEVVTCGSTYVASIYRGELIAATVSGTTVTLGSVAAPTTSIAYNALFALDASTVLCCGNANSTAYYARAYTVSGTTLTGGTEDARTALSAVSGLNWRGMQMGAHVMVFHPCAAASPWYYTSLYSCTGNAITRSDAAAASNPGAASKGDWIAVSGTKVLLAVWTTAGSALHCSHLTDGSGTLTASSSVASNIVATTEAAILLHTDNTACIANEDGCYFRVTTSGANPVIKEQQNTLLWHNTYDAAPTPYQSDKYSALSRYYLRGANRVYRWSNAATANEHDWIYDAHRQRLVPRSHYPIYASATYSARTAESHCWFAWNPGYTTYSTSIIKMEIAQ